MQVNRIGQESVSPSKREKQRTLCLLWRPHDTAYSMLPLHDKNLVTGLQTIPWIEAESSIKCCADDLLGSGELGRILTTSTLSQSTCTEEPGCKCLCRRIRRITSCNTSVLGNEPIRAGSFIWFESHSSYPLRRPKQSFTLIP